MIAQQWRNYCTQNSAIAYVFISVVCKSINTDEGRTKYRKLNNELRRETDKAKEQWWKEECTELEELEGRGRTDLVYAGAERLASRNEHHDGTAAMGMYMVSYWRSQGI